MTWTGEENEQMLNTIVTKQVNIELRQLNIKPSYENIKNQPASWSKLLILVGVTATLGGAVPIGFSNAVVNNPAKVIKFWIAEVFKKRFDVELSTATLDFVWSSVVSIYLIGGTISSSCSGWMANKFGRKGCFLICGSFHSIGATFMLLSRVAVSIELLLLGRLLVGFACGLTTAVLPMYLVELSPVPLRGTLGVAVSVGVNIGMVLGQVASLNSVMGNDELWHFALSSYLILVFASNFAAIYYPESPKYLYIVRNNREAAFNALARLRNTTNIALIESEIDEMAQEANESMRTRGTLSVLRDPTLLIPIILVCSYSAGQQFSGINAIFFYSVSIFEKAGINNSVAQWANLGCGVLNLLVALQSPWLMAKINRRPLMLTSLIGCSLFLICITIFLTLIETVSWFSILCIICILGYIFFYQIGLGPIAYFVGSEIVEVEPRPAVMGLSSLASWGGNFIVAISFPLLQSVWNAYVFLPFAVVCTLLIVLTKLYLPESRGRDSSQVAPLIANGFRSKIQ